LEYIITHYKSRYFIIIIVLSILFSTILDARRYRKYRRKVVHRRVNAADFLDKAIKKGDSDETVYRYKKRKKYKKRRSHRRKPRRKSKKSSNKISEDKTDLATPATLGVAGVVASNMYDNDEMKIQNSLSNLKLYSGEIDGDVNNFETRSAITKMNQEFGNGDTPFLNREVKDTLIYLSNLYGFNKNLSLKGDAEEIKMVKIQTALKILGFYHDEIDGIVGPGTRKSISEFKIANNLSDGDNLDFEEEYQLTVIAKKKNSENIEKAKDGLRLQKKQTTSKPKKDNDKILDIKEEPKIEKIKRSKSDIGLSDSFE